MRHARAILAWLLLTVALPAAARATPVTVSGDSFTLVATGSGNVPRYGLTSDAAGRLYFGFTNESGAAVSVGRFSPAAFSGTPLAFEAFGPTLTDGDGITSNGTAIFAANASAGITRIAVNSDGSAGTSSTFSTVNQGDAYGSPIAFRTANGHVYAAHGFHGQDPSYANIQELDASGNVISTQALPVTAQVMTYDAGRDLFYYSTFVPSADSSIYSFNPRTGASVYLGDVHGSIDGGLTYDPLSGLIFAGTAYGATGGDVYTLSPLGGQATLYASGFNNAMGLLREPVSGDLYFLEANALYRIEGTTVTHDLGSAVPEPATAGLAALGALLLARRPRRRGHLQTSS